MGRHNPPLPEDHPRHAVHSGDEPLADSPTAPRHNHGRSALTRRKIFGIAAASAVVSACSLKVAPEAQNKLAGSLGLSESPAPKPSGSMGSGTGPSASPSGGAKPGANGMLDPGRPKPDGNAPENSGQGEIGTRPPKPSTGNGLTQPSTPLSLDQSLHLARRAAWGPTPELIAEIKSQGTGWIDRQLKPTSISDASVEAFVQRYPTLGQGYDRIKSLVPAREKDDYFFPQTELQLATLARAAWSKRQLFEVLVDFFHDRLHVPAWHSKTRFTQNDYDVRVIREHTVGKFSEMVEAMVLHPAMLSYLDNNDNTKSGGNQNLGRELLELHTLGVDAGYTQTDVENAAKLLTGLQSEDGKMSFNSGNHFFGPIKVFGKTYSNAPGSDGLATITKLVDDLTHSQACAESFCLDLARKFVSDAPPLTLIKRLAKTYLAGDTAIAPVVKELLTSAEFKASVGQKFRRPMENAVAAVRVLGLQPVSDFTEATDSLRNLKWTLRSMGQSPMERTSPDGYPDFARPWLSTVGILSRWNLQIALVGGWHEGFTKANVEAPLAKAQTYGEAISELSKWLLFQEFTSAEREAVLKVIGKSAGTALTADQRKNDYNLRVRIPSLILGAPQHQLR